MAFCRRPESVWATSEALNLPVVRIASDLGWDNIEFKAVFLFFRFLSFFLFSDGLVANCGRHVCFAVCVHFFYSKYPNPHAFHYLKEFCLGAKAKHAGSIQSWRKWRGLEVRTLHFGIERRRGRFFSYLLSLSVSLSPPFLPPGSPSRGGDAAVYVSDMT